MQQNFQLRMRGAILSYSPIGSFANQVGPSNTICFQQEARRSSLSAKVAIMVMIPLSLLHDNNKLYEKAKIQ
jgi:hypothetical protein